MNRTTCVRFFSSHGFSVLTDPPLDMLPKGYLHVASQVIHVLDKCNIKILVMFLLHWKRG